MTLFLDTSALYAVLDRDDGFHRAAGEVWSRALAAGDRLVSSNYVVLESFALIQSRLGMEALRTFHDDLLPVIRVEWVIADDHRAAAQTVLASNRRGLSLVDCTSFTIMRRLGLRSVATFDRHFAEQGFQTLPA